MRIVQDLSSSKGLGEALTGLTDALERAMTAGQFLECLVKLAGNEAAGVSRRALKLMASRMAALASSAEGPEAAGCVPSPCNISLYPSKVCSSGRLSRVI